MVRQAQKEGQAKASSPEVARVASSIKKSDAKDFASTKHKGLPMKKESAISEEGYDRMRDKKLEQGTWKGGKSNYKAPYETDKQRSDRMKKSAANSMKALNIVKDGIRKKYGKGAIMGEENLSELDKKTLGRYVKKASTQMATSSIDGDYKKTKKRQAGVFKAVDKMSEHHEKDENGKVIEHDVEDTTPSSVEEAAYTGPDKKDRAVINKMYDKKGNKTDFAKKAAEYEKNMDPKKRQALRDKATKGMKFTHEGTSYGLYKGDGKAKGAMAAFLKKAKAKKKEKEVKEGKDGLWDNIRQKKARIKAGSGEKKAQKGDKDYPKTLNVEAKVDMKTPDYKRATVRDKRYGNPHGSHELGGGIRKDRRADHEARRGVKKEEVISERQKDSDGQRLSQERGRSNYGKASVRNMRASGTGGNAADPAERLVAMDARHKAHKEKRGVKKEEAVQEAAWQNKEGKSKTGGLNEKGRKSYERENPGSDLKAPQPKGGPRKRSFCARMGGVKGPMMKDGKPTRKKLALDKWKCNEEVKMTKKAYNKLHKDFKSDDPKNPRTTKYVPGKGTVSMPVKFVEEGSMATANKNVGASKCWTGYKRMGTQKKNGKTVPKCVKAGKISLGDFLREGNPTSRMLSKSKSQVTGNISADRGTDEKKNKASRKGLEKDLKKKGIGYKKGVGEYKYKSDDGKEGTGREVSYQTSPGKGMSKRRFGKLTRRLGRKHGQESVITKDKNKPARLHDTQSKKPGKSINIGKSKPGKSKTGDGETSGTKVRSGKLQKKTNKPSYHYG